MVIRVGIEVLGPLAVDGDIGSLSPRDRIVLAALTVRPGEVISTERLAEALWGERPPASWSKVVAGCVMRLRKVLGAAAIDTVPTGYRLAVPVEGLDAHRFERLGARGRELLALGEPERAAYVLDEALALWRGRALADLDDWEVGRIEAGRLDALRLDAEEARLDANLRAGRHREVFAEAQKLVAEAPLRERRWALLALAQYQAGRQGEALRTLHRARRVLAEELGLDPGPDLVALEQAILRHDPSLMAEAARPEPSATCPYLGLVPYDVGDGDVFFGREAEVVACLRSLEAVGVLTLVGPSGSGKSSLVRAGLAAALLRDGHRIVVVTPGVRPMDPLTTLATSGPPPVLVVDQCEELFTLCEDPDERARFLAALIAHVDRGLLVVVLRADRLGDLSAHPAAARLVERNLHVLSAMDDADLRAAISGPADQAGLLLEPGLVDVLVREVEGEPGALPLLSHALRQTWERREGGVLTVAGYQETGGIRGAVAQSAERVYAQVPAEQRSSLRDLLLRLVSPGSEGDPVRSRVPRRLVATDAEHEQLVELLVNARLVTSDNDVVELAHEALARAWPRLREWLDDDVEGQRIQRHLSVSADAWDTMGRPDSELYRGGRLAQALEWRERAGDKLSPTERAFLDAGRQVAESEARSAEERARHQARVNRRLRVLVTGVGVLLVVALVAGVLALRQADRADDQATFAEARRIGAQALVERRYDRALLLAVEAVHLWDSPETRANLLNTIERNPRAVRVIRGDGARLTGVEASPDGQRVMVFDNNLDITMHDQSTRDVVGQLSGTETSQTAAEFTPNGETVAVSRFATSCYWSGSCTEFGLELLDARDLSPRGVRYEGLGTPAIDVAYSPDGELLAAIAPLPYFGPLDNIAVWRVDEPDEPMTRLSLSDVGEHPQLTPDSSDVPEGWVQFSPDGSRLYASGYGPTVAFDASSGEPVERFDGLGALALSTDGRTLVIRTATDRVGLFDTASGAKRAELVGHDGFVTDAAFGPDGTLIATVSNDQTVIVWDAAPAERLHEFDGHAAPVLSVDFSANGSELYTSGADGSVIVWDLDRTRGLARELVPSSGLDEHSSHVQLSPTTTSVLLGEFTDGPATAPFHLLDVQSGTLTDLRIDGMEPRWGAYGPDGRTVAMVGLNGEVRLWDVATAELLATQPGRGVDNLGALAFTADGGHIVVADADGTITELDATTLEPTGRTFNVGTEPRGIRTGVEGVVAVTLAGPDASKGTEVVFADLDDGSVLHRLRAPWELRANFSPDGRLYAYGGFDGILGVVDVATGKHVESADPIHHGPIAWVTFSPDSATVASMGFDGQLALSDATTLIPLARMDVGRTNLDVRARYHQDGHTLVIAYENGTVISYDTDPAAWEQHACAVAGRNLTESEWRETFGDRPYRETCPAS